VFPVRLKWPDSPGSFASGDGLTRERLMGTGGHVVLARTRSSALTPRLSE
jgi:hypothetical protein